MADETNREPIEPSEEEVAARAELNEEVQQANQQLQEEDVAVTPEYDPEAEIRREPEAETPVEEGVNAAFTAASKAEDNAAVEGFDSAVKGVMQAAESGAEYAADTGLVGEHHHGDTFAVPLLGMQMTLPGGIYTFVFGMLAVLTVLEVLMAELLPSGWLTIALLLIAAVAKALLVVTFYMHLASDNRIFRVVLLLPLVVVLLSILYLLGVPVGAGLGYGA
ncbi:MAG: cytochrome C oxidase subunit IV family protein [Anaerolineae bacterium]|nr:cytochrome C oxidase subunit IV family protein [Anaerolineae bacterium]